MVAFRRGLEAVFVIKSSPKLVPVTRIRTNMRTAGMSRERYFQRLVKMIEQSNIFPWKKIEKFIYPLINRLMS